MVCD
jgi:hypothetical protein